MFEKEINFIYDFSSIKVKDLGNYFTFDDLSKIDLHPAILKYISGEISYLIYEDRQKLLRDSSFDYNNEKIEYYLNLISEELKANKRFSQSYISKMLLQAISFNVHYLVQPRASILKFIFGNSRSKTVKDIIQIMNYVYYYEYLKKLIISYLKSKKLISISIDEFEELLLKIDKLTVDSDKFGLLETGFSKIADFMNYGSNKSDLISYKAVLLFLKDKLLLEDRYILMNRFTEMEHNKISYKQIIGYLKEKSSINEETEVETLEEAEIEENLEIKDNNTELVEEEQKTEIEESIQIEENDELQVESSSILEEEVTEIIDEENKIEQNKDEKDIETSEEEISEDDIIESFDDSLEVEEIELDEPDSENNELFEEVAEDLPETSTGEILLEEEIIEENTETQSESQNESIEEISLEENESSGNTLTIVDDENISQNIPLQQEVNEEMFEEQEILEQDVNNEIFEEQELLEQDENLEVVAEQKKLEPDEKEQKIENDDELEYEEGSHGSENKSIRIDINEIIENKKISKVIEEVFDYDMEEFTNVIDNFNFFDNFEDAKNYFYDWLEKNGISAGNKNVKLFLDTMKEYFN